MTSTKKNNITTLNLSCTNACLIVLLSIGFLLYKYLLQVFPAVMTTQLQHAFHLDAFGLGNLAACFFYAYFVMQLFAGPLLDKYPLKYISALTLFIAAIGAYLFATTTYLWVALIARFLMGAGAAFATVSYLKMAAIYFKPNYYSIIAGLLTIGVMAGALCAQAPLALSINHIGWHHSVAIISIAGFIIALCYLAFPKAEQTYSPPQSFFSGLKNILSQKHNWYLLMYSGLAFAPFAVFGSLWGIPFIKTNDHLSAIRASEMVSWMYIGFGVGGPLFGYIANKIKKLYTSMFIGLLLSLFSLCIFIYATIPSHFIQSFCLFLLGFGTGAFMLGFNLGKNLNKLAFAATVVAVINTGDAFLGGITDPLIGKILDLMQPSTATLITHFNLYSYYIGFSILPIYLILSLLCLCRLKHMHNQDSIIN